MAATNSSQSYLLKNRKQMRQKQGRRKTCLMKKASEYSKTCNADVCAGIRLRETGQVFILSADITGSRDFLKSQIGSYYPVPRLITERDLEKAGKSTRGRPSSGNEIMEELNM
ncbi:uncharacterized protein N7443_008162 [Penicillium atrosanguineum]|uniref:uncharacterized protein n=1 Tax=Penicillium atrosanguineum TaxID=1132637 RepID=UPI002396E2CE|nr:uncharacterized protein N7443_008162 [Penicillium atrosanguineum]KAJ5297269.1 hypothetical protein N7443_008162 [Penicillium atrosanguineum]